jgi:predicted PurR-regulated permease PerM
VPNCDESQVLQDLPARPERGLQRVLEESRALQSADILAIVLTGLFAIAVIGTLAVAKTLVMPMAAALMIGTMLSAGARTLEKYRIPRSVSVALMLILSGGTVALFLMLISSPLMAWMSQLPALGPQLREKLHIFDRPLALWNELQSALGIDFSLPKIEWVQPTLEFLSPTLTEFLLFFVTLVLFTMSWPNLRRSLVLAFDERESRLQALRILNEIEERLGNYLLTVTVINLVVGILTCLISMVAGLPNAAALGALAAVLNYIPIIGPALMLVTLTIVGILSAPTLAGGMIAPAFFSGLVFLEGHFITPSIVGRGLSLNALVVFFAFAFWTWLWGPMGAFLASPMLIVGIILCERLGSARNPAAASK